jgi:hypothetical protein
MDSLADSMGAYESLDAVRARIAALNEKLRPIANRPVDTRDPNWIEKMRNGPRALDEAGIRVEAEAVLNRLLDAYAAGDERMRASIRDLVATNRAFAWATGVPLPATTVQGFRRRLLWMSAIDQSEDFRDTMLTLREWCETATAAGVDVAPILAEVAELSSDAAPTNMGSLKSLLQRRSGPGG